MAEHKRKLIRQAVKAALATLPPATLKTVETSRRRDWQEEQLPAAAVYTPAEDSARASTQRQLQRQMPVVIDLQAEGTVELDDTMDALALAVEGVMAADPRLGGLATDSWLSRTETGFLGEAETGRGLCKLTYTVVYFTRADGTEV